MYVLYAMYLWISFPETVSLSVKGIASRLWPSCEQFTLPLDASKRVKMAMWDANEIASDDCIQLVCGPQGSSLRRNIQFVAKVGPNPLSQFGRKPTQDRVCRAVRVGEVLLTWGHTVILNNVCGHGWRDGVASDRYQLGITRKGILGQFLRRKAQICSMEKRNPL